MNKVINLEDKDIKFAILNSGTYLVDGELVKVNSYKNGKVGVRNIDDIRIVTNTRVLKEYHNGEISISVEEYENMKEELLNNTDKDEHSGCYKFKTLEDEYTYKILIRDWNKIYVDVQSISDPIKVEEVKVAYDTGNKYIKNCFLNGIKEHGYNLYQYNREGAWLDIVYDTFTDLGMQYKDGVHYTQTDSEKVWGNSSHSCITYVTAFGGYVFGDKFKNPHNTIGTLEDMKKAYEYDKKDIEEIIRLKYNKHFGKIDTNEFDFDRLLKTMELSLKYIEKVSPMKKTSDDYYRGMRYINESISQIQNAYK